MAMEVGDVSPVMRVDEQTLLRDVYRIIFDNEYSTAELLEQLGTASTSPTPCLASAKVATSPSTTRRVTISEEVTVFEDAQTETLDLPPALALLYYTALAAEPTHAAPNLLYALELLSGPAPPELRGNLLYAEGLRKKKAHETWREAQQRTLIEEELKECTFKPTISPSAQEVAPKGLDTFMEKCVEWRKTANTRLAKKAAQERAMRGDDDCMTPWKMGARSRTLVEKATARGKSRETLWEPKHRRPLVHQSVNSSQDTTPPHAREDVSLHAQRIGSAADDALSSPSFRPVIRTTDAATVSQLLAANADARSASRTSGASESSRVEAYLQRVEADQTRRIANVERLRQHYTRLAQQQLYEKGTGQPLFEPNALPTIERDGKRIPFDALTPTERRDMVEKLRRSHKEHVLIKYFRHRREPERGGVDVDDLVGRLLDRSGRERRMSKLRRAASEGSFRPELSVRTRRMTERAPRTPVHARPLPRGPSGSPAACVSSPSASDDAAFARMLSRAGEWAAQRERRRRLAQCAAAEREAADCRFRPTRVSGGASGNDTLAAHAAVRMRGEVELLRAQSARRDAAFMQSVGESVGRLTLATAPRPSRRCVEQYAAMTRSMGEHSDSLPRSTQFVRGPMQYDEEEEEDFLHTWDTDDAEWEEDPDGDGEVGMSALVDSWAELDAQTDAILKKCQYY